LGAKDIDPPNAKDAIADLQNQPFSGARQAIEVARLILSGDRASACEAGVLTKGSQATSVPSSETVQNPADE